MTPAVILAAILLLPSRYARGDVQAVADEIGAVSANRDEAAALISLAWHETKFASAVMEGRCSDLHPRACDSGRALGVWQLHKQACTAAWALASPNGGTAGQRESLREQARCAIRLLRWNAKRGRDRARTPLHAAFAGYAARPWNWAGAEVRVATVRAVLRRMP